MRFHIAMVAALLALLLLLPLFQAPNPLSAAAPSGAGSGSVVYQIVQHHLPNGSSGPWAITSDGSKIWFVEQGSNQIGSFDPSTSSFSEYEIPTASAVPQGVSVDSRGNVWFTELTSSKLGEIGQGDSSPREISIPAGPSGIACGPIGVTPSSSDAVWVTCEFSNQVDEYHPTNDTFREFNLPVPYSAPLQITFDSAGDFWFTAADAGMLGYATVSQLRTGTSDGIQEFAPVNQTYLESIKNPLLPSGQVSTSLLVPSQLALAPDGNSLWISEHGAGSFDRYYMGSKTLIKYFTSTPTSRSYSDSLPNGIAVDSSGNLWLTEHYGNRIAEFNPATGSLTEYPIPCCGSQLAGTLYLTTGANGTVWFTEFFGNAIGELRPIAGSALPSISLNPGRLVVGPSGNAAVQVKVSPGTGELGTPSQLSFAVAGVTRSGRLQNVSVAFEPASPTLGQNSTVSTLLKLQAAGLKPGVYYLTVAATITPKGIISGKILELDVEASTQPTWLVDGVIALVAAVILTALFFLRRKRTTV